MQDKNPLKWSDIESGYSKDMARYYGLDTNLKVEQAIRKHTEGATHREVKDVYKKFFNQRKSS